MFKCEPCGWSFEEESNLNIHKKAIWCNECQEEVNCKNHNFRSRCTECDLEWYCDTKYDTHWEQEHNLECDVCQSEFAKESTLKYHNQEWYCKACEEKLVCEEEFRDHAPNSYPWTVKNLRPDYTAKIPLEAFEKVDEASVDREHTTKLKLLDSLLQEISDKVDVNRCQSAPNQSQLGRGCPELYFISSTEIKF